MIALVFTALLLVMLAAVFRRALPVEACVPQPITIIRLVGSCGSCGRPVPQTSVLTHRVQMIQRCSSCVTKPRVEFCGRYCAVLHQRKVHPK